LFRYPIASSASREAIAGPEGGSRETLGRHFATLSKGLVVV
jgi:hypothetical protein